MQVEEQPAQDNARRGDFLVQPFLLRQTAQVGHLLAAEGDAVEGGSSVAPLPFPPRHAACLYSTMLVAERRIAADHGVAHAGAPPRRRPPTAPRSLHLL